MKNRNILITGASSGLGLGLLKSLPTEFDKIWVVSRSELDLTGVKSKQVVWIKCDLSISNCGEVVKSIIKNEEIDLFIHAAGVWEDEEFNLTSAEKITNIINTNLTSFLLLISALFPNITAAKNSKIIAIGSIAGLDNWEGTMATYAASKMGLKGAINGVRQIMKPYGTSVTCLTSGSIATDISYEVGVSEVLAKHKLSKIPIEDFTKVINMICDLSPASCVKEIVIPAHLDKI